MLLFPTIFCALKVVNMVCLVFAGLIVTYSLMQLQDAGCWTDAATLAAAHLKGTDYSRSLSLSLSLSLVSKGFFPSLARVLYQFLVAFSCYIFVLLAT